VERAVSRRARSPRAAGIAVVLAVVASVAAPAGAATSKPVKVSGSVNVKGSEDVTGDDPATLDVTLDDFFISPTFTKATPGQEVTVKIKNSGGTTHTFTSRSLGVDVELAPGKSRTIDVSMPERKGAYLVYCRIHRSSGMEGALWSKKGSKASDTPEPDAS
jgi:plastocyanin